MPVSPLLWFAPWRMAAGAAGAVLMVLAGPAVQAAVPLAWRGLAAGVMFAGVGLGIMAGAALVPALLPMGIAATWLALAAAALALAALSWWLWPDAVAPPAMRLRAAPGRGGAGGLVLAYALAAVAATPQMVWWPDFIARFLGLGTGAGALYWLAFGIAAASAPALLGRLADRIGAARTLRAALVVQIAALALPLLATGGTALLVASLAAGGSAIGFSALTLTRTRELAGDAAPQVWRLATAAYGGSQSVASFALAGVLATSGAYWPLFGTGLLAAIAALVALRR